MSILSGYLAFTQIVVRTRIQTRDLPLNHRVAHSVVAPSHLLNGRKNFTQLIFSQLETCCCYTCFHFTERLSQFQALMLPHSVQDSDRKVSLLSLLFLASQLNVCLSEPWMNQRRTPVISKRQHNRTFLPFLSQTSAQALPECSGPRSRR